MALLPLLIASAAPVSHAGAVEAAGPAAEAVRHVPLPPFPILIAITGLVYLGTLAASRLAIRLRLPAVLGVLALGLLLSPSRDMLSLQEVENLHVVSLSILLFCSGLNANLHHLRSSVRYALLLTAGGALLTTLLFAGLIWGLLAGLASFWPSHGFAALPFPVALLLAACVSCTDASATLDVLQRAGLRLAKPLEALVLVEGSINDSLAILLLLLMSALAGVGLGLPGHGHHGLSAALDALQAFLRSIGTGVMMGLILTYLGQAILRRFVSSPNQVLLLGIALALSSYGLTNLLHGSGFIAAYVTGLFLANDIYASERIDPDQLEASLEAFNTLTEYTVMLLFGTHINPNSLGQAWLPGLLGAAALVLIARPLSVLALRPWSPLSRREELLLSWCGLRGAVSVGLGYTAVHAIHGLPGLPPERLQPLMQQVEGLIAVVVIGNLCLQGLSLPPLARRLGLSREAG